MISTARRPTFSRNQVDTLCSRATVCPFYAPLPPLPPDAESALTHACSCMRISLGRLLEEFPGNSNFVSALCGIMCLALSFPCAPPREAERQGGKSSRGDFPGGAQAQHLPGTHLHAGNKVSSAGYPLAKNRAFYIPPPSAAAAGWTEWGSSRAERRLASAACQGGG